VVDLAGHTDAATNLLNEPAYDLMREGELLFTDFPRVYNDERAIYGLTFVVDRTNGSRARTSLYISRGRPCVRAIRALPAGGVGSYKGPCVNQARTARS
jgi:hypothetical protein